MNRIKFLSGALPFLTSGFMFGQFNEANIMISNTTPTYEEMVGFYQKYASENEDIAF